MTKDNSKPARERRKADAERRAAVRATRTDAEQIALLETRPGEARRERDFLGAEDAV